MIGDLYKTRYVRYPLVHSGAAKPRACHYTLYSVGLRFVFENRREKPSMFEIFLSSRGPISLHDGRLQPTGPAVLLQGTLKNDRNSGEAPHMGLRHEGDSGNASSIEHELHLLHLFHKVRRATRPLPG